LFVFCGNIYFLTTAEAVDKLCQKPIYEPILMFTKTIRDAYIECFKNIPDCAYLATILNPHHCQFAFSASTNSMYIFEVMHVG